MYWCIILLKYLTFSIVLVIYNLFFYCLLIWFWALFSSYPYKWTGALKRNTSPNHYLFPRIKLFNLVYKSVIIPCFIFILSDIINTTFLRANFWFITPYYVLPIFICFFNHTFSPFKSTRNMIFIKEKGSPLSSWY